MQVPAGEDFGGQIDDVLLKDTSQSEMVSVESIRAGALTELMYSIRMEAASKPAELIAALQILNGGQKVTLLTGYDQTDL
jgi:hypothetical protein